MPLREHMNPGLKPAFIHSNAGACESLPSLSLGKMDRSVTGSQG